MEETNENMFTVMPMSQTIKLKPGEKYQGSIKVVNPTDAKSDFAYKTSITPYGVQGEDYTALLDERAISDRTSMSKWIKIEEPTGKVKPNETKEVKFTIDVPENAAGGGQYATITITSDLEADNSEGIGVQNVFEMASIIYATVDGDIIHEGKVLENNVPSFVTSTPITVSALIENTGNVHESAVFTISVSDFFTGNVILPTEENTGTYSEIIMPETTRNVEREVSNLPALGIVKVKQSINYKGEVSTVEKDVFICPVWFLILIIATIAAIVTTIVLIVKKHRKKNKRLNSNI